MQIAVSLVVVTLGFMGLVSSEPETCSAGTCSAAGEPHGGTLVNTIVPETDRSRVISEATATLELSERQACDVALLINGGFSPLTVRA